jgi:MFS superfamily sulfate permease-like transporter
MSTVIVWFFGVWTALFVGVALSLVGFDLFLTHRREAMRKQGEVK